MERTNLEKLRIKTKNTAYARFFAARRYKKINSLSLFSLTVSSFSLIFITLADKYSEPKLFIESTLDLILLISAIIISALSLAISLSNYAEKSIKMLKSGEELNELVRKLDNLNNDNYEQQKLPLNEEYNTLIKYSENHQEFEFFYGRNERKREESEIDESKGNLKFNKLAITMWLRNKTAPYMFNLISLVYILTITITLIIFIGENGLLANTKKIEEKNCITDKGIVEKNVKPDF